MRGLPKSKKVTWASDVNLCQVKLFLSEDSPSLVGLGVQDHLQAKASWPLYSSGAGADDNLPPGFEGTHPANVLHKNLSQIPIIQWQCPPRFAYDPTWLVVAGEESNEVERQNEREMRVLEAIYPRTSSIPPNPSLLAGVDGSYEIDQQPPLIPITPIEDDDTAADTSLPQYPDPVSSHPQQSSQLIPPPQPNATTSMNPPAISIPSAISALGVEPDIIKAAYNALSAVMANNQATQIDPNLLITILKNPNLLEKLGATHGACSSQKNMPNPSNNPHDLPIPSNNPHDLPNPSPQNLPKPIPGPQSFPKPRLQGNTLHDSQFVHISRPETVVSSFAATPSRPFYPPPCRPGAVHNPHMPPPEVLSAPRPPPPPPPPLQGAPGAKDLNYYKNLIQQHGGERQEPKPQFENHFHQLRPSQESANRSNIMKPCIYFNTSRGCRYGANCAYQHDVSTQQKINSMPEVQSSKRTKIDREVTGT